jgi:cytoskeleton protein RodZ
MNEPTAVEPHQVRGDESAHATPAGFGYALAQARTRAGLSVEQAAGRIRLQPRQLRAIENEDLRALPGPAYVNGFVRNYAREVGLDPVPLIEDLNAKLKLRGLGPQAPDLGTGGAVPGPTLDERAWRHLVLAGIVIALVCAGLIGVWMARPVIRARDSVPQRTAQPAPAPASEAPGSGAKAASPARASEAPGSEAKLALPARASEAPGSEAKVAAAAPGATRGGGTPALGGATPVSGPGPAAASAADSGASTGSDANAGSNSAAVDASGTAPAPAAGASTGLVLRFDERSWVEVRQPDGRVLLSRFGEAGSMETVNSPPPLELVIGRAEAVQVEFQGQPVNLRPYINSKGAARVVLGDDRVASGGQSNR